MDIPINKPDVRRQIKKYLGASGVSQVWLSNKIGMNPSTLSVTLNEKRTLQAEEFFLICDALNVSYDYFRNQNNTVHDYNHSISATNFNNDYSDGYNNNYSDNYNNDYNNKNNNNSNNFNNFNHSMNSAL